MREFGTDKGGVNNPKTLANVICAFPLDSGGPVFGTFVGKHTDTPVVSESKISLVGACGGADAESEAESEAGE